MLQLCRSLTTLTLLAALGGCSPALPPAAAGPDPLMALRERCPGGVSSDGDCCVKGQACGASCIAAEAVCSVGDAARREVVYSVQRVASPAELPKGAPAAGVYRVHLIDVGTGLAVLVQGHDFAMLFDGGSGDDKRGLSASGNNSRLLAYLWQVLGPSGPEACAPRGDGDVEAKDRPSVALDHVFLSHPHEDHGVFLDELLTCYEARHVWDVGVVNDAVFYRQFLEALAGETGATYHTVAAIPADRRVEV
ncbi:MAG: hypothetical protein KC731_41550, partial [Myxococcales bacterium]|nr:hypothetical protein [Myxococcales bacterium]